MLLPHIASKCLHGNPCGIEHKHNTLSPMMVAPREFRVGLQAATQGLLNDLFFADQSIHNQAINVVLLASRAASSLRVL